MTELLAGSKESPNRRFEATRWSVILAAGQDEAAPELAHAALAQLCQTYWAPLYGFVRSRAYSLHDAQDFTKGFFAQVIEHRIYTRTNRAEGKFRSFLLAALKNFLSNARDREHALKRGGAREFLPLHEELIVAAEAMFQSSVGPDGGVSGDRFFERQWAETLIGTAFRQLSDEFAAGGKGELLQALKPFVRSGVEPLPSYDELAPRLGMPPVTVRSQVNRMRARYRVLIRAELRRTVETEAQVDGELNELLRVLTNR